MSLQFLLLQIQKTFFCGVLFAIVFSFTNLSSAHILVHAVDPAPNPAATTTKPAGPKPADSTGKPAPKTDTATPSGIAGAPAAGPKAATGESTGAPLGDQNTGFKSEIDPRIGGLKQCSITGQAPEDVALANKFLADCIKSVIQLVVGISVILAIMSMIWLGIQSLNSFTDQANINKELSERIQGFVVGALILGLFASILGTINPASLNINNIFSTQIAQDIRNTVKNVSLFGNSPSPAGSGAVSGSPSGTTSVSGDSTSGGGNAPAKEAIDKLVKDNLADPAKKTTTTDEIKKCYLQLVSSADANCAKYANLSKTILDPIIANSNFVVPTSLSANGKDITFAVDLKKIITWPSGLVEAEFTSPGSGGVSGKTSSLKMNVNAKCVSTPIKMKVSMEKKEGDDTIPKDSPVISSKDTGCSWSEIKVTTPK